MQNSSRERPHEWAVPSALQTTTLVAAGLHMSALKTPRASHEPDAQKASSCFVQSELAASDSKKWCWTALTHAWPPEGLKQTVSYLLHGIGISVHGSMGY